VSEPAAPAPPPPTRAVDGVVTIGAGVGLAVSLALHLAVVTARAPAALPMWTWSLHAGAILGFWTAAGRITAAGLRGLSGLLRIRRMVPIPVRLALGAATVNAGVTASLGLTAAAVPGRALTAYWILMYLLITILFVFVVRRPAGGVPGPARPAA